MLKKNCSKQVKVTYFRKHYSILPVNQSSKVFLGEVSLIFNTSYDIVCIS